MHTVAGCQTLVSGVTRNADGRVDGGRIVLCGFAREAGVPSVAVSSADAALIARVPEMVELLRELEWCESASCTDDPCCPWCKAEQEHGTHSPDCRLHAILKLAEEPE